MDFEKLKSVKALIVDMDGVLWRESAPIGNLPCIFNKINALGLNYILATNNATRTPQQYVHKLAGFGVKIPVIRELALQLSRQHRQALRENALSADAQARFTALAEQSLADQAALEAQPQEDFAAYVAAFQASL